MSAGARGLIFHLSVSVWEVSTGTGALVREPIAADGNSQKKQNPAER